MNLPQELKPVDAIEVVGETARYVDCDFCYESATEDIWNGQLDDKKWRKFYKSQSDGGLIVCEHCVPVFMVEGVKERKPK